MTRKLRVYERFKGDPAYRCLVVENGVWCPRQAKVRGLCGMHYRRMSKDPRLEAIARPPVGSKLTRKQLTPKEVREEGICPVVENGEPCMQPATRRGLCRRHYQSLWQRKELDLFVTPSARERTFRLKRKQEDGICRIREGGEDCYRRVWLRGLCTSHYRRLGARGKDVLERYALPAQGSAKLTLRQKIDPRKCRVCENGVGCPEPAEARGLCRHHYNVVSHSRDQDLLGRLATPPRRRRAIVFERRDDAGRDPLVCVVIENGVPCSEPPEHRGVCHDHRRRLSQHPDHSLEEFYLPEQEVTITRKSDEEAADGLCLVKVNGQPCRERPYARGLCRPHLKVAYKEKRVDELGLPPRSRRPPVSHGKGNDRPHFYLDKNVLYDHADHEVFGASGQGASVALVRAAKGPLRNNLLHSRAAASRPASSLVVGNPQRG